MGRVVRTSPLLRCLRPPLPQRQQSCARPAARSPRGPRAGGCPEGSGRLSAREQQELKRYRPTFRLLGDAARVQALLAAANDPATGLTRPLPPAVAAAVAAQAPHGQAEEG